MDLQVTESHENAIILDSDELQLRREWAIQNPRDLSENLKLLETLSTSSVTEATSNYYTLKQGEKNIYGLSIRFAELIIHCFPNLGISTRIDKVDKLKQRVTVTATATDFEHNCSASIQVTQKLHNHKPSEADYKMAIRATQFLRSFHEH